MEKFIKVYVVIGISVNPFGIVNHNVEGVLTNMEDTKELIEYLKEQHKDVTYVYHQKFLQYSDDWK